MRTKLKWTVIVVAALIFAGLQFTSPARTNPPFKEMQTLEATTEVPSDVSAIFARSCNDCHSNRTSWRWYTHIAPASWLTVRHVNEGRAELNFSEWGSYSKRVKETRLKAICYHSKHRTMPLYSYALAHPSAKLSDDEIRLICDWAEAESRYLAQQHKTELHDKRN